MEIQRTTFMPEVLNAGRVAPVHSVGEIESEPMIYGGSWNWTRENCGPITSAIMDKISYDVSTLMPKQAAKGYHPVIDTKSVMLMPEWVPCIPGWHCDGALRANPQSQPDLETINDRIHHYICYVSSVENLAPTEVITEPMVIPVNPDVVWGSVDENLRERDAGIQGKVKKVESGEILRFTRPTLHRGTPAAVRGWRYFFRLSFYHMPAMNQFRHQVQVYPEDKRGW